MTVDRTTRTNDQHSGPADPVISTLMTSRVVAVLPGMALIDALRVMDSAGVRHLPVMENDRCVGLLTEIDMLRQLLSQGLMHPESTTGLTVGQLCRRPAPVVPEWGTRATAAQVMLATGSDAVVVQDNEHLLGIITATDLARSLTEPTSPLRSDLAPALTGPLDTDNPPPTGAGP